MNMLRPKRVCVIGAGVSGLSTAVRLLQVEPNLSVTIVADKFTPKTTSDGAAGVNGYMNFPENSQLRKWSYATHNYTRNLYQTHGALAGVSQFLLILLDDKKKNYNPADVHSNLSSEELEKIYPGQGYKYGTSFITFLIECKIYLPWLMQRFKSRGGTILKKHINSFNEIADDYDVIVNCSGLGARQLANDHTLRPIRGQLFRVKAPWIKLATFKMTDWIHIFPTSNDVVVGGVTQPDNWDLSVNHQDGDYIWEKACKLDPTLKHAQVVSEWVGLRPGREVVRLEREDMMINGKTLCVVHNYGHGSRGVALHWGCAGDASELVLQYLKEEKLKSKL